MPNTWICPETWLDLAFVAMSVEILQRVGQVNRPNIAFDTTLSHLIQNKIKLNLKLRTFKGGVKRADGDNDVGRRIWKLVDELGGKGVSLSIQFPKLRAQSGLNSVVR